MKFSFKFGCILVAALSISGGSTAQTNFPPCPEDASHEIHEQCECPKPLGIYRGEYRNPERRYQVHLPDGVAAFGPCGATNGFAISLTHPDSGGSGEDPLSHRIWVFWWERPNQGLQQMADQWAQSQIEFSQRVQATDLQIDSSVQTSLSSLPAIELKASYTKLDHEKVIFEEILAKGPDNSVYLLGMTSPADRYDKDHELFQAIVKGFLYIPSERSPTQ
jgi:hypothetical protein